MDNQIITSNILDEFNHGILLLDQDKKIIGVNKEYTRMTGQREEDVINKKFCDVQADFLEADPPDYQHVWQKVNTGQEWNTLLRAQDNNNDPYLERQSIIKIDDSSKAKYMVTKRNITKYEHSIKRLDHQTKHSPVTKLPTRTWTHEYLSDLLPADEKVPVINIRVKKIEQYNRAYGQKTTDDIMHKIAEKLKYALPNDEVVLSKAPGAAFTVHPNNPTKNPEKRVKKLFSKARRAAEAPLRITGDDEIKVQVNGGWAVYPDDSEDVEELTNMASTAAAVACDHPERILRYDQSMVKQAKKEVEAIADLRRALENDELIVYYQPQYNLKNGQLEGAEALLRWCKDGEVLTPGAFLPALEHDASLARTVDRYVLKKAINDAKKWPEDIRIGVNISPYYLDPDYNLAEYIDKILSETRFKSELLDIEITETEALDDLERTASLLKNLEGMDVRIALDDFGTGYSSMEYLAQLPADTLKIDTSFVGALHYDQKAKELVSNLLTLADRVDAETIAEGVERKEHVEYLKEKGCNYAQGFYYSEAVPNKEFKNLLNDK